MRSDYSESISLYGSSGRKYLNGAERRRALAAMGRLPTDQALFALMLAWTGARISEVLALRRSSIQIESSVVAIQTLKRRAYKVREVPIPRRLVRRINRHFRLAHPERCRSKACDRLWPWSRTTGWRIIKHVMCLARVAGTYATARGLRHSFGIGAIQAGVPLTLVQRWMGHARLSTTAIYLDVSGPEEIAFARQFWRASRLSRATICRRQNTLT